MWRSPKSVSTLVLVGVLAAFLGLLLPSPASASGDDYPYRAQANSTATDRWGFTARQCVSFAAWRLEQTKHAIHNSSGHWGSGYHWDDAARSLGKRVTTAPKVGAVAQWNAGESSKYYASNGAVGTIQAGSQGHVAYVSRVYGDGSVQVEQYNMSGNRSYSTMHVRAPRYIYVF